MWAQWIVAVLGIWMMFVPSIFEFDQGALYSARIVGPFVATFATVAVWECSRNLRLVNIPLGIWIAASVIFIDHPTMGIVNNLAAGALIVLLSFVQGKFDANKYGGGWKMLWGDDPYGVADGSAENPTLIPGRR